MDRALPSNILIINKVLAVGRVTAIIVKERPRLLITVSRSPGRLRIRRRYPPARSA
jgi:hypothetical protein